MIKEKILAYCNAHREEMVADICSLVQIESTKSAAEPGMPYGPGPREALRFFGSLAEKYGFTVTDYDGRLIAVDMNEKPRKLDMLAHLDVVPAGDGWTVTDAFTPLIRDNLIFGRGTSDDKGPAVSALYAMRAIRELDIPLSGNVRLILGSDEESGMSDKEYYYAHEEPAGMTFSPDADFPIINTEKGKVGGSFSAVCEPVGQGPRIVSIDCGMQGNVISGKAKAVLQDIPVPALTEAIAEVTALTGVSFTFEEDGNLIRLTAIGKGGHAAEPYGSNNSLTGLLELLCRLPLCECGAVSRIRALATMFPHGETDGKSAGIAMANELSGDLTAILTVLHFDGHTMTGIFDTRIPLQATPENTIDILVPRMAKDGFELKCSFRAAHHVPADSILVGELLACYEAYTGRKATATAMGGSTYVHGLPGGVAFGCVTPGTDTHMHGADEFAEIDVLVTSAAIFTQAIADLCGE